MPLKKNRKSVKKYNKKYTKKNNTLFIRRSTYNPINVDALNTDRANNYYFQISQIPNHSELENMFQKIKLLSVDCEWIPKANSATLSATGYGQMSIFYAFNGNNDTTGVPTLSSIMENNKHKTKLITDHFKFRVYPVVKTLNSSTSVTYYTQSPSNKMKFDSDSLAVRHYGLDWVIPSVGFSVGHPLGVWKITYNIVGYLPR